MMDSIITEEQIGLLVDSLRDALPIVLHSAGHFVVLKFLQRFPNHAKWLIDLLEAHCQDICTGNAICWAALLGNPR